MLFQIYMVNGTAYNENSSGLMKQSVLLAKGQVAMGLAEDGHRYPRMDGGDAVECQRQVAGGLPPRKGLAGRRFGLSRRQKRRNR